VKPDAKLDPIVRVSVHFCLLYAALGAILPYVPVWLKDAKGLSSAEIGLTLACISFVRVLAGPLVAAWAEGLREARTQMVVLAVLSAGLFVGYGLTGPVVAVIVVGVLFGVLFQTQMPLGEANAMRVTEESPGKLHYGHIRALGSATFIVANLGAGMLIQYHGAWAGYGWIVVALTAVFLASLFLPGWPRSEALKSGAPGFGARLSGGMKVFRTPGLLPLVIAASLIQAAHGFYYGFASNLWIAQGVPASLVGMLWSVGVVAEIAFLVLIAPRLDRVNPALLLLLAAAASVLRWGIYATAPPVWLTLPLQALHLATFGLTLMGTMRYITNVVAPQNLNSAQQLASALVFAPVMGVATLSAGFLEERFGAGGYAGAAVLALIGGLVALTAWKEGARSIPPPPVAGTSPALQSG
jgi:MFS transporter, PPP family, 3-phenylpropionic acid transporter